MCSTVCVRWDARLKGSLYAFPPRRRATERHVASCYILVVTKMTIQDDDNNNNDDCHCQRRVVVVVVVVVVAAIAIVVITVTVCNREIGSGNGLRLSRPRFSVIQVPACAKGETHAPASRRPSTTHLSQSLLFFLFCFFFLIRYAACPSRIIRSVRAPRKSNALVYVSRASCIKCFSRHWEKLICSKTASVRRSIFKYFFCFIPIKHWLMHLWI